MPRGRPRKIKEPTLDMQFRAEKAAKAMRDSEWYGIRSLMGFDWALFFILLGARESGKSYAVMEYFVACWKKYGVPFYWLRLNEASMKKMLNNNAEKLVDADLYRKYDLKLSVKGNTVYDRDKKMATVLALSTFANDKGVALFDKDFLSDPNMQYHICLDEFQLEKGQKRQGDIAYQLVNQLENLLRSTKQRTKIFLIGNTLEEASDILTLFDFIPERFGRYKIHKKRCIIDYLPPTEKYKARRKGTVADILAGEQSNFTNAVDFDSSLVTKERLVSPTCIIKFGKNKETEWFTIWNGNIVNKYNGERIKTVIAMKPYIDEMFDQKMRDQIYALFDSRSLYYHNLITNKKFQKQMQLIKPRKSC